MDAMKKTLEYDQQWLAIHSLDDHSTPKAMHNSVQVLKTPVQMSTNQSRKRLARQANETQAQ
jgi:hypothetical protein